MFTAETHKLAAVSVVVVGNTGSGKSTLVKDLIERLQCSGYQVKQQNAGDAFREPAQKQGMSVEQFVNNYPGSRRDLDWTTDMYMLNILRHATGLYEWHKLFPTQEPVYSLSSGRMLGWLAEIAIHSGDLPPDGIFRVKVECTDQEERARRLAHRYLEETSEVIEPILALGLANARDARDMEQFRNAYGVWSEKQWIYDPKLFDLMLDSSTLSPKEEVELTIRAMRQKGILALNDRCRDSAGDLVHV